MILTQSFSLKFSPLLKTIFALSVLPVLINTSGAATDVSDVNLYGVSDKCIAVEFVVGQKKPSSLELYTPLPADEVRKGDDGITALIRDGEVIGALCGPDNKHLYKAPVIVGNRTPNSWLRKTFVSLVNEAGEILKPAKVYRKTKPIDKSLGIDWKIEYQIKHVLFFEFSEPLVRGQRYEVKYASDQFEQTSFVLDDSKMLTRAIQVSQLGHHPEDLVKYASLSLWKGDGGGHQFPDTGDFSLIDEDGREMFSGEWKLVKAQSENDDSYNQWGQDRRHNTAKSNVYRLDFSNFKSTGTYRVWAKGVGVSKPIVISNDVYKEAFIKSVRGLYHQRSGIELKAPFTDYARPLMFHPDMGKTATLSATPLQHPYYVKEDGQNETFKRLPEKDTGKAVTNFWGGYSDAGDWDRRIQHLQASRFLFDLYERDPEMMGRISLNIPESNNQLPDIIDEALWGMEIYLRLQGEDGGVSGWIESEEHPKMGEVSWIDSLDLFVTSPDMFSSYTLAATAAKGSRSLESLDPDKASKLKESALKAMAFAEKEWPSVKDNPALMNNITDLRNLAAVELFLLTDDEEWHQVFLETSIFRNGAAPAQQWNPREKGGRVDQLEAAFTYARMLPDGHDKNVVENIQKSLSASADFSSEFSEQTGYGWTKDHDSDNIAWGTLGKPQTSKVLRAYILTGEEKYLKTAERSAFFPFGMNGDHLTFTTGIGNAIKNPLLIDAQTMSWKSPEGITVYGPWDPAKWDYWGSNEVTKTRDSYPPHATWPAGESTLDLGYLMVPQSEFTVHSEIAPMFWHLGSMAIIRK